MATVNPTLLPKDGDSLFGLTSVLQLDIVKTTKADTILYIKHDTNKVFQYLSYLDFMLTLLFITSFSVFDMDKGHYEKAPEVLKSPNTAVYYTTMHCAV